MDEWIQGFKRQLFTTQVIDVNKYNFWHSIALYCPLLLCIRVILTDESLHVKPIVSFDFWFDYMTLKSTITVTKRAGFLIIFSTPEISWQRININSMTRNTSPDYESILAMYCMFFSIVVTALWCLKATLNIIINIIYYINNFFPYSKLRQCFWSDSASPKPRWRRRATLMIHVVTQCS